MHVTKSSDGTMVFADDGRIVRWLGPRAAGRRRLGPQQYNTHRSPSTARPGDIVAGRAGVRHVGRYAGSRPPAARHSRCSRMRLESQMGSPPITSTGTWR